MSGIFDYITWRGDLSFSVSPVNEVDLAVLSQIVMLDLKSTVSGGEEGSTLAECAQKYAGQNKGKMGFIIPAEIGELFDKMGRSARFGGLVLHNYVEDIDLGTETQFSAIIADSLAIKARFVIFSGTDDTLVGWKENFALLYKNPTEAQVQSARYLTRAAEGFKGKIYVVGHSKGGHLAMYSALHCNSSVERKICRVVNFDGPGFPEKEKKTARFTRLLEKTETILPQSSVVGRLFEHEEKFRIIHSDGIGLIQHDLFSWQVLPTGFKEEDGFDENGTGVNLGMNKIIAELSPEEREEFCEGLFNIFYASSCATVTDLAENGRAVIRAYFKTSGPTKKAVNRTLMMLLKDKYIRKCLIDSSRSFKKNSEKK